VIEKRGNYASILRESMRGLLHSQIPS